MKWGYLAVLRASSACPHMLPDIACFTGYLYDREPQGTETGLYCSPNTVAHECQAFRFLLFPFKGRHSKHGVIPAILILRHRELGSFETTKNCAGGVFGVVERFPLQQLCKRQTLKKPAQTLPTEALHAGVVRKVS